VRRGTSVVAADGQGDEDGRKEHLLAAVSAVAEDQVVAVMDRAAPHGRPLRAALPALSEALVQVAD
jgi:hypothetical protein